MRGTCWGRAEDSLKSTPLAAREPPRRGMPAVHASFSVLPDSTMPRTHAAMSRLSFASSSSTLAPSHASQRAARAHSCREHRMLCSHRRACCNGCEERDGDPAPAAASLSDSRRERAWAMSPENQARSAKQHATPKCDEPHAGGAAPSSPGHCPDTPAGRAAAAHACVQTGRAWASQQHDSHSTSRSKSAWRRPYRSNAPSPPTPNPDQKLPTHRRRRRRPLRSATWV